eukprot:GEMP01088991.1.p1 GENE.GEMP01088991.1~~GEMP01088991.1.p1  ORF type:complete len:100 (-),score=0.98 GEMP01088991.1:555-854(-)
MEYGCISNKKCSQPKKDERNQGGGACRKRNTKSPICIHRKIHTESSSCTIDNKYISPPYSDLSSFLPLLFRPAQKQNWCHTLARNETKNGVAHFEPHND